VVHKSEWKVL